jgi:hypothetical protein
MLSIVFQPNAVCCVSYQSLSRSWHTDFDYRLFCLPDLETGAMVGVSGRQGMLTPPRHLIPPMVSRGPCWPTFSDLYFLQDLWGRWLFIMHAILYRWYWDIASPIWDVDDSVAKAILFVIKWSRLLVKKSIQVWSSHWR